MNPLTRIQYFYQDHELQTAVTAGCASTLVRCHKTTNSNQELLYRLLHHRSADSLSLNHQHNPGLICRFLSDHLHRLLRYRYN